jgi:hypothetical protein
LVEAPSKKVLKLYKGLPKAYSSILVQIRSQRIGLRHFLFKHTNQRGQDNQFNAGRCHCDKGSQTPRHILLQYPLYTSLRETMLNKIWYKTDLGRTTNYNTIVSDSQTIRYVAEFMHRTGLLGQFRDVEYEDVDANIDTLEESGH